MYIETKTINQYSINKKIKQKSFSLHFLPECLNDLVKRKHIEFSNQKLKVDYLVDIVHNLLLKYYFKKENKFALNATILKSKYGYLYNYYISFLIENNIIRLHTNYKKGKTSRIYSLDEKIFTQRINRYRNYDKVLLKKYKGKFIEMTSEDSDISIIEPSVREKLVNDLFNVKIDYDRAIFFLDLLKNEDIDIYNRNIYSVECINDSHIFYHFDSYGRMHTNYTILKSFIRKNCLLIDGLETCELDIPNSQPLFLVKLINISNFGNVDQDEFELFKKLTIDGNFYQYFMSMIGETNKKLVKEMTYKVLFGRNIASSKADKYFKSLFPTIYDFIKRYKKENGDYRVLAYDLQRAESSLIFNKIIRKVMNYYPEIKMITIHDSIVVPKIYREEVNIIFENELKKEFNI